MKKSQQNKNKRKVGVIVPSYNQGKYLEKALVSIINNMEYSDITLIVMDGGSTDNSIDIIRKYEEYITYWQSEKDNGQAAAINEGVKYLNDCDYIMWLNSDDEYDNDKAISKIADFAQENQYQVCYGQSFFIDYDSNKIGYYPTESFDSIRLRKGCFLSQPSVLVDKKVWDEYGGLNENLRMCLDYEFWLRLSKRYTFGYIEEFIGNTRIYDETKTATMQVVHIDEAICVLHKLFQINIIIKLCLYISKRRYIKEAEKNCSYY